MISLVHPGCNANVREVAKAFEKRGKLEEIFTSISGWKGLGLFRKYPEIQFSKISTHASREYMRLICQKVGIHFLTRHEKGMFCIDRVWREIDQWASENLSQQTKLVYAYEDAAYHSFKRAKAAGLKTVYDLPIGYWKASREIYKEEQDRFPEFASLIQGLQDSEEKLERKDRELELADRVHACSGFVKSTLIQYGYPEDKIRVMQFGAPSLQNVDFKTSIEKGANRPFRVLFVGRMDQRKGIGYLLKAMQHFDPREVEFHMIGSKPSSMEVLSPYWGRVVDHGTMSQKQVWEIMKSCDLFVFPSLFEGQALVVLEAMACGLPVVVTPHAGADRVVRDGLDGFVIPIRSTEEIVNKIVWMKSHPEERNQMAKSAMIRSHEFTWEGYQKEVLQSAEELLR
ncbi:MAG: glycosyltransferase family 4 protein [Verrucomicrobiota bacterium]